MKKLILVLTLCILPLLSDGEEVAEEFSKSKMIVLKIEKLESSSFTEEFFIQYLLLMNVPEEHIIYIVAQARLESANYSSKLFKEDNSILGMNVPSKRTKEFIKSFVIGDIGNYKKATYLHWTYSAKDYLNLVYDYHINKDKSDYLMFLTTIGYCELGSTYTEILYYIILNLKKDEVISKAKSTLYVL